jgi:hypothetical protein
MMGPLPHTIAAPDRAAILRLPQLAGLHNGPEVAALDLRTA